MEEGAPLAFQTEPSLRTEELRTGIVGTGFIGRVHARSALLAGGRIAGVAASSPERSAEASMEMRAETGFATAEDLIESDEIDVVHVCTPNHLHVSHALAALRAGKHVICEKPIALDEAGARELETAARESETVLAVPFVYRYYPTVREARARIANGSAGAISLVHGGYLQDWLLSPNDDNWRVDPGLGGASRAFADIGSHWCDLIEFVTGERIVRLAARTAIAHPERAAAGGHSFDRAGDGAATSVRDVETEDIAALMFELRSGVIGSAVISQVAAGRKNHLWFEISGSAESLFFDQEAPESLWVGRRAGGESIPRDFGTLSPEAEAYVTLPGGHPQGYADCFDAFVADAYSAIRGEGAPVGLPLGEDGSRAVAITGAVLRAASTQDWVEVT
ncbi:MAG TPA: Gfo/Idh/MocA family oxidoreductase [Solirubrobacterales bacterium]|nr:Gfo/Idh/MocA family oxidoreductase [Solirubrobacterales bacterium]